MEAAEHSPAKLVIIHSNDIHSRLENAARIASIIAGERDKHGADRVLALDIGDHIDRMRAETEGSDGAVNIELLNAARYDAVTLGNNEGLTYVPELMGKTYRELASFDVLCANMRELGKGASSDWIKPSAIVRRGGITVGLIAVTANFIDFYSLIGWDSSDPLEAVQKQVEQLRGKADVIAVMSHVGFSFDRRLAENVSGIDLIMGGHTHHLLEEPLVIGDTFICAAGKHGEYAGLVEIEMKGGRPRIQASCIPVAAFEQDPASAAIIERYSKSSSIRLSRVVTRLDVPLPAEPDRETPLCNLLAAGLRRWTGAQIGLVNNGQLLGGLAVGEVTDGLLHALCPSPINPCKMLLKGADLKEALEQSLLPEFVGKAIKGFGFRGHVLGTLSVDGMEVTYDTTRDEYDRIVAVTIDGKALDEERSYEIGTIDMFTFKVGYESLYHSESRAYYLPEFIRDILANELQNPQSIRDSSRKRWLPLA